MIKINRNCVEFIFPDRDCDGKTVDPALIRNCIISALGSIGLGGSFSEQAGVWVNQNGQIRHEGNEVLRVSFAGDLWPEMVGVVMKFSALVAMRLKQAELAVHVNGTLVITSTKLEDGYGGEEVCVDSPKPKSPQNGVANSLNSDTFSRKCIQR